MGDIDTAKIRAGVFDNPSLAETILDLCDALDASRALGQELRDLRVRVSDAHHHAVRRAEAAEARIAKAMSICAEYAYTDAPVPIALLERALTGGPE